MSPGYTKRCGKFTMKIFNISDVMNPNILGINNINFSLHKLDLLTKLDPATANKEIRHYTKRILATTIHMHSLHDRHLKILQGTTTLVRWQPSCIYIEYKLKNISSQTTNN